MAVFCVFPTLSLKCKSKKKPTSYLFYIVYTILLTDDFNARIIHVSTHIHISYIFLLGAVKREDVKSILVQSFHTRMSAPHMDVPWRFMCAHVAGRCTRKREAQTIVCLLEY